MNIETTRFGTLEVDKENFLTFPSGIIGFPLSTQYFLLDHSRDVPFKWLQSVQEPHLAFVVMDPALFKPDYRIALKREDIAEIGAVTLDDLLIFVILTVPSPDPTLITANLRGPVVVNARNRLAKQVILQEEFPTRYPLFQDDTALTGLARDEAQAVSR